MASFTNTNKLVRYSLSDNNHIFQIDSIPVSTITQPHFGFVTGVSQHVTVKVLIGLYEHRDNTWRMVTYLQYWDRNVVRDGDEYKFRDITHDADEWHYPDYDCGVVFFYAPGSQIIGYSTIEGSRIKDGWTPDVLYNLYKRRNAPFKFPAMSVHLYDLSATKPEHLERKRKQLEYGQTVNDRRQTKLRCRFVELEHARCRIAHEEKLSEIRAHNDGITKALSK